MHWFVNARPGVFRSGTSARRTTIFIGHALWTGMRRTQRVERCWRRMRTGSPLTASWPKRSWPTSVRMPTRNREATASPVDSVPRRRWRASGRSFRASEPRHESECVVPHRGVSGLPRRPALLRRVTHLRLRPRTSSTRYRRRPAASVGPGSKSSSMISITALNPPHATTTSCKNPLSPAMSVTS